MEREGPTDLTNLPKFKPEFVQQFAAMGIYSQSDLHQALNDEEWTMQMIASINGLGPKTVEMWRETMRGGEVENPPEEQAAEPEAATEEITITEPEAVIEETVVVEEVQEAVEEQPLVSEETTEEVPPEPLEEQEEEVDEATEEVILVTEEILIVDEELGRQVIATVEDLKRVLDTAKDLLKMNGAKNKGLRLSVEYLALRLSQAGLKVIVESKDEAPVVTASMGEGGVVLWANLDTEPLGSMRKKSQGKVRENLLYGRGVANVKGAVAALICAVERMASWDVPFTVILTTDALGDQSGAKRMAVNPLVRNGRGVLMLRPTSMQPVIGHSGHALVRATIEGEESVVRMMNFLEALTAKMDDDPESLRIRLGSIRGGAKDRPFESPQKCEVFIELTTLMSTSFVLAMMEGLLSEEHGTIKVLDRSHAISFDPGSDLMKAIVDVTGKQPINAMGLSEAFRIVDVNPRICIWGPGTTEVSQGDNEFVPIQDLQVTYETILKIVDYLAEAQEEETEGEE